MTTFLGFFKNNMTAEEFVAPVDAETRNDAEWVLIRQYPQGIYSLLTIYARTEVEKIMTNIDRWPGLASKVQPSIEQMMSRVSVGTRLPPMPNQRVVETPAIDGARIERVREAVKGAAPEVQELAARLLAAQLQGSVSASTPDTSNARFETVSDARMTAPVMPPVAMPKAVPMNAQGENRPSLISVLKAMRG